METHLDPFCPVLTNLFFFPFRCVYMSTYVYVCVCRTVSYCVALCRTVSYCVVPCRTVSYRVVPCRTVSYCVVPCRTVSYCVVRCRTVSVLYDTLYDTVRRVVHPRRVRPRHLVRHCTTRRTSPTHRAPTPCTTPRRVVQCISDSTPPAGWCGAVPTRMWLPPSPGAGHGDASECKHTAAQSLATAHDFRGMATWGGGAEVTTCNTPPALTVRTPQHWQSLDIHFAQRAVLTYWDYFAGELYVGEFSPPLQILELKLPHALTRKPCFLQSQHDLLMKWCTKDPASDTASW